MLRHIDSILMAQGSLDDASHMLNTQTKNVGNMLTGDEKEGTSRNSAPRNEVEARAALGGDVVLVLSESVSGSARLALMGSNTMSPDEASCKPSTSANISIKPIRVSSDAMFDVTM